jgi:hypothetical protein
MKSITKLGLLALTIGLTSGCATINKSPSVVKAVVTPIAAARDTIGILPRVLANGMGRIEEGRRYSTSSYGGPYWSTAGSGVGCGTTIDVTPIAGEILGDVSNILFTSGTDATSWKEETPSLGWGRWLFPNTLGTWVESPSSGKKSYFLK